MNNIYPFECCLKLIATDFVFVAITLRIKILCFFMKKACISHTHIVKSLLYDGKDV